MATVSDALDRITESTLYLDPESVAGTLVVAATPSITTGWLLSLIRQFNETYPEIELRLVNIGPALAAAIGPAERYFVLGVSRRREPVGDIAIGRVRL